VCSKKEKQGKRAREEDSLQRKRESKKLREMKRELRKERVIKRKIYTSTVRMKVMRSGDKLLKAFLTCPTVIRLDMSRKDTKRLRSL
jgi:hypothetical protein